MNYANLNSSKLSSFKIYSEISFQMLKHVQISPLRNRSDSISLRSSTSFSSSSSCASSLCGSPEPSNDYDLKTSSRSSSYSSLNDSVPQVSKFFLCRCNYSAIKISAGIKTRNAPRCSSSVFSSSIQLCMCVWVEKALCHCDNVIPCHSRKERELPLHKANAIMHTEQLNASIFMLDAWCFLCRSSRRFGSIGKCHYSVARSVDDAAKTYCLTRAIFNAALSIEEENWILISFHDKHWLTLIWHNLNSQRENKREILTDRLSSIQAFNSS